MYAESRRDSYGEHAIVYKCWLSARPLVSSCLGGRTPTNCPGTCDHDRKHSTGQPQRESVRVMALLHVPRQRAHSTSWVVGALSTGSALAAELCVLTGQCM
jgi:hypothetical protein